MKKVRLFLLAILFFVGAACTAFGPSDPIWDTQIPDGAPIEADLGTWSPDGRQIAFVHTPRPLDPSEPGFLSQLWTYDFETKEMKKVLVGPSLTPKWHPTEDRLVFHSGGFPQYLFTIKTDGTELRQLTGPGSPHPGLEYSVTGRWHPDGDRLLFAVGAGDRSGIYTINAEGGDLDTLATWSIMPDYFPDGKKIVYVSWDTRISDENRQRQLYVMNADGSRKQKLTDFNQRGVAWPRVSPDGSTISFTLNREVHLMDANGENVRQVTGGMSGFSRDPEWSPDGSKLLFSRVVHPSGDPADDRLYILDVETREVEPVFSN